MNNKSVLLYLINHGICTENFKWRMSLLLVKIYFIKKYYNRKENLNQTKHVWPIFLIKTKRRKLSKLNFKYPVFSLQIYKITQEISNYKFNAFEIMIQK